VYAFPRIDQWVAIHSVNILTGTETLGDTWAIYAGTRAKLHPAVRQYTGQITAFPSGYREYDINGGPATYIYDSPYHGDYSMCGDLWISEDGPAHFHTLRKCVPLFPNRYSSGTTPEDMTYNGALQGLTSVKHLSHSQTIGKVAAVPELLEHNR